MAAIIKYMPALEKRPTDDELLKAAINSQTDELFALGALVTEMTVVFDVKTDTGHEHYAAKISADSVVILSIEKYDRPVGN